MHRQMALFSIESQTVHGLELPSLRSSEQSRSPGGNLTHLLTGAGKSADGAGLTQMLVVSSSVGMVHGVHPHSLHLREVLLQPGVLVVQQTRLQDGLVVLASGGDDAHGGPAAAGDGLSDSGGQSDSCLETVVAVADDGGVGAGRPGEGALVSGLGFDVADGGSLGDIADGQHVPNGNRGLLAAENVLTGVGALSGQEVLDVVLVFVGVPELHLGQGGSSSGVVDEGLDDASDVPVPLAVVESPVVGRSHSVVLVGLEDPVGLALPLASDHLPHQQTLLLYQPGDTASFNWQSTHSSPQVSNHINLL